MVMATNCFGWTLEKAERRKAKDFEINQMIVIKLITNISRKNSTSRLIQTIEVIQQLNND